MKVDMLHMALSKAGINSVRILARPDDEQNEVITKDFEDTVDHLKNSNTYYNAFYIRFPILKKIIDSASVVCTTLDAMSGEYLAGQTFPRVIVDDASQCFEPLVLSALTKNCQHVVLFGDHKLAAPQVNSELSISKGLKISIFER
jgi:superfamily I DNA and/or RNA helicase